MVKHRYFAKGIGLLLQLLFLSFSGVALAQQQPAGVVTGIQGQAQLSRPTAAPAPLRFRDGVIIRDVVDTREKSLARILFGGRSTVTVRELSRLEVTEEILPTGARRDVHDLSSGAILVNVARQLMRPGDELQIRTPNAVAAVRGSTIFAQFNAITNQSFFALLSGNALVTPQGQATVTLSPNTGLNVTGTGPTAQVNQVTVTQTQANQILAESQVGKAVKEEGNKEQTVQAAVKEAVALANVVIETVTKTEQTTGGTKTEDQGDKGKTKEDSNKPPAPVTPDTSSSETSASAPAGPSSVGAAGNIVDNSGFETTGSIPDWSLSGAGSSIESMKDSAGKVIFKPTDSRMAIIHTGTGAVCVKSGGCSGTSSGTVFERSVLSQSSTGTEVQSGKTYLIRFDYNFMTGEFPSEPSTFNDKFTATAKGVGSGGSDIEITSESRNSSTFKTDKGTISGGGFTLDKGDGYTDWKTASKTVQSNTTSGTLEFKIEDIGDNDEDSAVLIDNVVVKEDPPLYEIFNGMSLIGPYQKPLVEYYDQTATFDSVLVASGSGPNGAPSVSLSGPLLKAERSNLTVPFSLLGLTDNSRLVSTSSDPLVWLNAGNYSLSNEKGTSIFDFWGTKTAPDPDTGAELGTVRSLEHAGPLLEASGGATVSTQKVLKLDTVLLQATAPVINLLGTPSTQSSLTTETSTIDLMKSKVISTGPVVAMDKSFINVTNGALINLTHGSNMKVTGDLISMLSGSKINVVNGPLISVAGAGSLLDVSGALVNFGGTGGNKIVVNNGISPTATLSGLPVSATFGGSVNISNPIKNPSLGSISVNGSLISAANGGTVNIQGK